MAGASSSAQGRDRVDVVCLPEEQVDGVERHVVAEARGRIDRDESALGSAVEDVARRQVAVQEGGRRDALGEPGREPASAFVQLRRDRPEERAGWRWYGLVPESKRCATRCARGG